MPSARTIRRIVEFAGRLRGVDAQVVREGLEIAHLHHRLEQVIEDDLSGWGLTARQMEILECLYHNPEETMTPAALAEEVLLSRSAMTSALDALEKQGYTARRPHPSDRRRVAVTLTPAGHRFMAAHLPERYRKFDRVMRGLSRQERALLLRTYRKVLALVVSALAEEGTKAGRGVERGGTTE